MVIFVGNLIDSDFVNCTVCYELMFIMSEY